MKREIGGLIPATNYIFTFLNEVNGMAAYLNGDGLYRKISMATNAFFKKPSRVYMDSVTEFIELRDVEVQDIGLIYPKLEVNQQTKWYAPDLNVKFPPKNFKVTYGNSFSPQGTIIYFDGSGESVFSVKFGEVEVITATKFLILINTRLIEL
jgi:hypothetical protein